MIFYVKLVEKSVGCMHMSGYEWYVKEIFNRRKGKEEVKDKSETRGFTS